jgi:hypothetical protein
MLEGASFAGTVARMAVDAVTQAVLRDWRRVWKDPREDVPGSFCVDWFRGRDPVLKIRAFQQLWTTPPVLCSVTDNDELQLKLSVTRPVAVPA